MNIFIRVPNNIKCKSKLNERNKVEHVQLINVMRSDIFLNECVHRYRMNAFFPNTV